MIGDEPGGEAIAAGNAFGGGLTGNRKWHRGSRKRCAAAVLTIRGTMVLMRTAVVVRAVVVRQRLIGLEIAQTCGRRREGAQRQEDKHQ